MWSCRVNPCFPGALLVCCCLPVLHTPASCRHRHPGHSCCLAYTPCIPCIGFKGFLREDQHFKRVKMLHHYPVEVLQTADIAPRSLERAPLTHACCQGNNCPLLNARGSTAGHSPWQQSWILIVCNTVSLYFKQNFSVSCMWLLPSQ